MSSVTVPPADGAHRYGSDMAAAPVSLREKHAAQTRQRIVDVALGLFVDQGFDATTVDEIAEQADVSPRTFRSEEHTSELQSLMRISYAVFCLNKKKQLPT